MRRAGLSASDLYTPTINLEGLLAFSQPVAGFFKGRSIPILHFIIWLAIGGIAGYFAGQFMGAKRPYGIVGDVLLGIVGSVLGGWLLGILGFGGSGIVPSLVTAFIGASALIWLVRRLK